MIESENADGYLVITITVILLGLVVLVAVWMFGKLFRSKYSPFKFVNRLLDVEIPIRITTPLSPDATERRLKDRITRIGIPLLMSKRLVGTVKEREVKVRLHRQFMSNSFGPVFAGSISAEDGQTVLRGVYRLHKYIHTFFKVWFGFIIIWSTVGIPAGLVQLLAGEPEGAIFVVAPIVMVGFGVAFVRLGEYFGNKDHKLIAQKIAEAIGGTVSTT
ncbi:MAG: hypothetical protein QNK34_05130 [Woeseiaceae bacterium]|nr:hypothetical protein [Woeseiaceae bacterium]